jgi:putative oxidoreductase
LVLAIFAEAFCSLAVVAGAFYRLALIPLLFTMAIALFVVHNGQAFVYKELAFIYFVVYVMIYMTGAGGYSLDDVIAQRLNHNTAADSSSEG